MPLFRVATGQTAVFSLMYISAGTMLATGGRDGSIKIWDATTGVALAEVIAAHSDSVRGMACDSAGLSLVTASADMSVKLWKQVPPNLLHSVPHLPSSTLPPPPAVRAPSSPAPALFHSVSAVAEY